LSVCVGSASKILLIIAHSPEITHLNTLNRAFFIVSVFCPPEFAWIGGGGVHQNLNMEFLRTWFSGREISVLGRTRCGFPKPKPGNFLDMIFRMWDPQFLETWSLHFGFPRPKKTWEILGYGFQDLGSQLWGLDFHTHGFQDWNLKISVRRSRAPTSN